MRVVAVVNEKGGAGKSTLSINLAAALARQGRKVVIVDADPQGTARDWREATPEDMDMPPVVALDRPELLLSSLKTLSGDVLIIDTPAKAERMSANVIRVADVALIPVQPSAADVWASAATVKLIQSKRDVVEKLRRLLSLHGSTRRPNFPGKSWQGSGTNMGYRCFMPHWAIGCPTHNRSAMGCLFLKPTTARPRLRSVDCVMSWSKKDGSEIQAG